jgi:hypothetical protein
MCGKCITGRKEHRLRLFEKPVLTVTFRPKSYETIKGWRKLHKEKINELHPSPNV